VFGKAEKLYTKDGYIEFVTDNPVYIETIPADLREAQQKIVDSISSGELILPIPEL
jgi:simple sugar transport system substrate-binding protein